MSGKFQAISMKNVRRLLVSIILPVAVGMLSSSFAPHTKEIYEGLVRPPLAPPAWVFGVVWPFLYVLMGVAAYMVAKSDAPTAQKSKALWFYYVQLFVNFFWAPIFFSLQAFGFAFVWLLLLLVLAIITTVRFYDVSRTAGWLMVLYIAWLSFAGYLNYMIWMLN